MKLSAIFGILLCQTINAVSMRICPDMGLAADFSVIAATTITNADLTAINGDLAITPGVALTGFNTFGMINGAKELGTGIAGAARKDITTAYDYLAAVALTSKNDRC
ncbi:unnamed protein product [Rotaria magnacalcarata]|uniref:Antifreeze protein n=2 Tax=Rotaria magnacalcarata TaxID=392030 RepID=A0A815KE82_9BILA|nr:unnamed protein product [Rotaria magnacalcarata]CAF1496246.1 unnamed protein product [Rotaria magnacalcarata]CAF1972704.1 unnamed protein product [Rotaria magnacalcarata]CAF4160763.1 unnamed protein product [Rotaria magnacalcarata]CAF4932943.1 unnamed protein product [Rotaria magnacalcarata]